METKPPAMPTETAPKPTLNLGYIGAALVVGYIVQALAFRHLPSLGAAIAGLALTLAVRFGPAERQPNRWLIYAAASFFAALAFRASEVLIALNAMAGVIAVTMAAYSTKRPVAEWTVSQTFLAVMVPPIAAAAYGPGTTVRSLPYHRRSNLGPVLIGLLIGIPVLLVFGSLFASADAVFSDLVENLVRIEFLRELTGHVFWSFVLGSHLVGLWMFSIRVKDDVLDIHVPAPGRSVETATVLVLLNAMFALFVAIQIRYLFGGVEANAVTLSEHARRGFFELVTVASLVLAVVLVASWAGHLPSQRSAVVNWLSLSLIGLTALVLVSAVSRMMAYWDAFGLTELRLYTTVFMAWIAIALAVMIHAIRAGDSRPFVRVVLSAAAILLIGLSVANPDGLIARTNLSREAIIKTDVGYLGGLSVDRVPVVVDYLETHRLDCSGPLLADIRNDLERLDEDPSIFSQSWGSWRANAAYARLADCS